ncbi:MAG: hypothetical protein B6D55_02595 [Candidatus Omnitrophica bacterium 4484_70.2]|nr:MAG: hypothetical protein B6D55_02595 [Candidatus Omnitrophica bacterium 4484_70.2]
MELIFWLSLVVLAYTYFGYPLLLWIGGKLFSKPVNKRCITPSVTFIVVVYNEEKYIGRKIENILSLDYLKEKLEIIIGSDGSTDRTNQILEEYLKKCREEGMNYKIVISQRREGKIALLNEIVPQAKGEIIVFSDARQIFKKDALRNLVANFADENVGCVSGELVFVDEDKASVSKGIGFYWRYEKWMRKMESRISSAIGATGAIYAIRKNLYVAPPQDTILDDVFIPLKIAQKGFRVIFDSQAVAYDKVVSTSKKEFTRKVRTLAGNFQLFIQCRSLFNPFKSKLSWQLFSHKFLRAVAFFFLLFLFVTNLLLRNSYPYSVILLLQIIFYLLAVGGFVAEKFSFQNRILSFPFVFCILNFAGLRGFLKFIFGKQGVKWEKVR